MATLQLKRFYNLHSTTKNILVMFYRGFRILEVAIWNFKACNFSFKMSVAKNCYFLFYIIKPPKMTKLSEILTPNFETVIKKVLETSWNRTEDIFCCTVLLNEKLLLDLYNAKITPQIVCIWQRNYL